MEIFEAVSNKEYEKILSYLNGGGEINAQNENKQTLLMVAINNSYDYSTEKHDNQIVNMIMEKNPKLDLKDNNGETAIFYPIRTCEIEIIKYLIKKGADLNVQNQRGETPLIVALTNGSDFNANSHQAEIIKLLVEKSGNLENAIFHAVESSSVDSIDILADADVNLNEKNNDGNTPLIVAIQNSNLEKIRRLVARGADLFFENQKTGNTALHEAAREGLIDVFEEFSILVKDYNLLSKLSGDTLLMSAACFREHTKVVEFLLQKNASINEVNNKGETALFKATCFGGLDVVQVLIKNNADVTLKNKSGKTALNYAILNGDLKIIDLFLTKDADLYYQDPENGNTGFHDALLILNNWGTAGSYEVFEHLMPYLKDANLKNSLNDECLLLYAARYNHIKAIELLCDQKADANLENNQGMTPLMTAIYYGHFKSVEVLLERGADLHIKDKDGKNAFIYAENLLEEYKNEMLPILEKFKK